MMFTESPYSARLPVDLILSRKIVVLNKNCSEAPRSFSPLTCVGQWLSVASNIFGRIDIEAIFIAPAGHVVIILSSDMSDADVQPLIDEFTSWDCSTLDRIAEDFTFSTTGQAFTVCDLLAKHGRINFSQVESMALRITACMQSGSFSLFCFSPSAERQ